MEKKYFMVFSAGFVFGILVCIFIGLYNISKDKGRPLVGPKVHGNIRISRHEVDPKILPDIEDFVLIQKDDKELMTLFFDMNNKLENVSYTLNDKVTFISDIANGIHQRCTYGVAKEIYCDKNCDGKFDVHFSDSEKKI